MQLSSVVPNPGGGLPSNDIKVTYLKCTGGEADATSALAPGQPLGLSPKRVGVASPRPLVTGSV